MKKLMITAAAALCATVGFSVESQIVGYDNNALRGGNTMTGPDFIPCGGGKTIDLTDIKVGGEAYAPGEFGDVVYVQILSNVGGVDGNYTWTDIDGEFDPGWYDFNDEMRPIEKGDVPITLGDGLWVAGGDDIHLTYSGQVLTGAPVTVPLRGGNKAVANPFPTTIDLTDISVGGEAYAPGEFGDIVYVQILSNIGGVDGNYTWTDIEGEFDPGWYDFDDEMRPIVKDDVPLKAGQGLWVAGGDGIDLQFSPLSL